MRFMFVTLVVFVTANVAFAQGRAFEAEGISTCFVSTNSKDPYCKKISDKARVVAQIHAEQSCSPKYPVQITDWKEELLTDLGPDVRRIKSSALFECVGPF